MYNMMEKKLLLFLFCSEILVVVSGLKECRSIGTVDNSANSVTENSAQCGHFWQHVYGLESRPKGAKNCETQMDRSLFINERAYKAAWTAFKQGEFGYLTPKKCGTKPAGEMADCVLAADVGVNAAYGCLEVDKNSKLCTKKVDARVDYVEFWYANKGGKWILNTAFPSAHGSTIAKSCPEVRDVNELPAHNIYCQPPQASQVS